MRFTHGNVPAVLPKKRKFRALFRLLSVRDLKTFHAAKLVRRKTVEEKIGIARVVGMQIIIAVTVSYAQAQNFPRGRARLRDLPRRDLRRLFGTVRATVVRFAQPFGRQ